MAYYRSRYRRSTYGAFMRGLRAGRRGRRYRRSWY